MSDSSTPASKELQNELQKLSAEVKSLTEHVLIVEGLVAKLLEQRKSSSGVDTEVD